MSCYNSCAVNAPVDKVWTALSNFHDMSWASRVIESVEVVGDKGRDEIGAGRILNGVFHETLRAIDHDARVLEYSIDDGPGPVAKGVVNGYIGRVRVAPITTTDGSFIEWSSRWDKSNGEVEDFCNPIYQALMNAMVAHFG